MDGSSPSDNSFSTSFSTEICSIYSWMPIFSIRQVLRSSLVCRRCGIAHSFSSIHSLSLYVFGFLHHSVQLLESLASVWHSSPISGLISIQLDILWRIRSSSCSWSISHLASLAILASSDMHLVQCLGLSGGIFEGNNCKSSIECLPIFLRESLIWHFRWRAWFLFHWLHPEPVLHRVLLWVSEASAREAW